MSLDTLLDGNEFRRFSYKYKSASLMREMLKKTHFDAVELEALSIYYYKLSIDSTEHPGQVSSAQFRYFLYAALDMPVDDTEMKIMLSALDPDITTCVTLRTWFLAFSLFLRGTLDEKIIYCFRCYDFMGLGSLSHGILMSFHEKSLISADGQDALEDDIKDFVGIMVKKMDQDCDGIISFADYQETVRQSPAMLEFCGKVLPSREAIFLFAMTFTDKIKRY